jgi:hypothetical protein
MSGSIGMAAEFDIFYFCQRFLRMSGSGWQKFARVTSDFPLKTVREATAKPPHNFDRLLKQEADLYEQVLKLGSTAHTNPLDRHALYQLLSTDTHITTNHILSAISTCRGNTELRSKYLRVIESRQLIPPTTKSWNNLLRIEKFVGGVQSLELHYTKMQRILKKGMLM